MSNMKIIAVVGKRCVSCGYCVQVCKQGAVSVPDGVRAVVDGEKCIACAECVKNCPAGIISLSTREVDA